VPQTKETKAERALSKHEAKFKDGKTQEQRMAYTSHDRIGDKDLGLR
jgi:hypothetical protein